MAAAHNLTNHFNHFFSRLNPSTTFESIASREYGAIKGLIEDRNGPAALLSPSCFLQGSYKQQTAIYTINDVDIVALCELWQPGSSGGTGRSYSRDEIFGIIAAPLLADYRYRDKVRYSSTSMCIKVDLGIKVEILPVVYKSGNNDYQKEPFRLYRPENQQWEDGYARYHQVYLSQKNAWARTGGNFIPAIKVFKHLRSKFSHDAVSFHLECLLYSLSDALYRGGPPDYIPALLESIAAVPADAWYRQRCATPCGERDIFTGGEWKAESWFEFHKLVVLWAKAARLANQDSNKNSAIATWQLLMGKEFFPTTAS
jgi:Second Messenger Oligonucleotide or Dinucleotide Synthetase domain